MRTTQFRGLTALTTTTLLILVLLGFSSSASAGGPQFNNLSGPTEIELGQTYTYSVRVKGSYDKADIAWSATGGEIIKHYWEGANYLCTVRWQKNDPNDPAKIKVSEKDSKNAERLFVKEKTGSREIEQPVAPGDQKFLLDANGGQGKPVLTSYSGQNENFLWKLEKHGDYVKILSKVRNAALDANGGKGTPYLNPNTGENENLLWKLNKHGQYVMISPKVNPGATLDANGGKGSPYLSAEPNSDNVNHLWLLAKNDKFYKIFSKIGQ